MAINDLNRARPARSMSRRHFLHGVVASAGMAVAAQLLAACGDGTAATTPTVEPASATSAPAANAPAAGGAATTLTLMMGEGEFSNDQLKAFTDANPSIAVERIPADEAQLKTLLDAGTPPDLIRTDGFRLANLAQRGLLLDLTDYFNASALIKKDDLAPPSSYYQFQGGMYGMPKDWSPDYSLFVSSTAFEQADVPVPSTTKALTYPDLHELARKLTKRDGDKVTLMGYGYSFDTFVRIVQGILAQRGEKLYKPDFSAVVLKDNPAATEILQYFLRYFEGKCYLEPTESQPQLGRRRFSQRYSGDLPAGLLVQRYDHGRQRGDRKAEAGAIARAKLGWQAALQPDRSGSRAGDSQIDQESRCGLAAVRVLYGRRAGQGPCRKRLGCAGAEIAVLADAA